MPENISRRQAVKAIGGIGSAVALAGPSRVLADNSFGKEPPDSCVKFNMKGISYGGLTPAHYSKADSNLAIKRIKDTGANWISIIPIWYQDGIDSTIIGRSKENTKDKDYKEDLTISDKDVEHIIADAKGRDLRVLLKPHLNVVEATKGNYWRGRIGENFNDEDWSKWFKSYSCFILHYAALAQAHHADLFCVGTELKAAIHHFGNTAL